MRVKGKPEKLGVVAARWKLNEVKALERRMYRKACVYLEIKTKIDRLYSDVVNILSELEQVSSNDQASNQTIREISEALSHINRAKALFPWTFTSRECKNK